MGNPYYQHPPPEWCISYNRWTSMDTSSSRVHSLHWVHSWWFGQTDDTSHHCSILQSSFTALKIVCALPVHPSPPRNPGSHWSFYCLLSFCLFQNVRWLDCAVGGHLQLVPSTCQCTFQFLHVFSWLDSWLLLVLGNILSYGCSTVIYPFTYWGFGNYE